MFKKKIFFRTLLSVVIGFCLSLTSWRLINPEIKSVIDLYSYLFFFIFSLATIYFLILSYIEGQTLLACRLLVFLALIPAIYSALITNQRLNATFLTDAVSYAAIIFSLMTPFLSSIQRMLEEKNYLPLFFTWLFSLIAGFWVIGFLSNFYTAFFEIMLLTLLSQAIFGMFFYYLFGRVKEFAQSRSFDFSILLFLYAGLLIFVATMFKTAERYPSLFYTDYYYFDGKQFVSYFVTCFLSAPLLIWLQASLKNYDLKRSRILLFFDEHLAGLLLAALFFGLYFIFVSIFNRPTFDVDNIFFDADGLLWRMRLTTGNYQDYYWRSVHPFALLLLRPPIKLIAFFLKGDDLSAAFLFFAFAGASCVFLSWIILKRLTQNTTYALLISSLIGASTAYLVFSSLFETYIFLGAGLLLFYAVLLDQRRSLLTLVLIGLPTFGITLTNIGQSLIALLMIRRDLKMVIKYGFLISIFSVALTLVNNLVYFNANPLFFVPSAFETGNAFPVSIERIIVVVKTILLHSVVAPNPLILKEEIPFMKVWFYRTPPFRLADYNGLIGNSTLFFWLVLVVIGGILFLKNIKREDNRFALAFLACIMFNFVLHMKYGTEIFLYAANWTYAVILFLALAWRQIADKRWFQITLLVFLSFLLINNSRLLITMLNTASLHIR